MTHTEMRAAMERYKDFRRTADYHRQGHHRPDRTEIAESTRMQATGPNRNPTRSAGPDRPDLTPRWLYRLLKA